MRKLGFLYLFIISSFLLTQATFKNEVKGFHIPLIGLPLKKSIFFHKPVSYQNILIYTATEKNILAAIDYKNGSLVWRQEFAENDPINVIKPLDSTNILEIITLSNSSIIRAWNALTGFLIWEKTFSNLSTNIHDINFFENNVTSNKDIIVLASEMICSLNSDTGSKIWSYNKKSKTTPLFLSVYNSFIYLIKSSMFLNTYYLSISKLDGRTGNKITSNYLFSTPKLENIVYTGSSSLPIIAWKNSTCNSIYIHILNNNITHIINTESPFDFVQFYLPENFNTTYSSFLLQFTSISPKKMWASVFSFNSSSSILKLYEISSISNTSYFFPTTYISNTFFIHSFINKFGFITINIYSDKNNSILSTWNISQNQFYNSHIEQTVSKIIKITNNSIIAKSLIVTHDALIYMIQGSFILWSRDESLAYSIHAEFLELPQKQIILTQDNINKKSKSLFFIYMNRLVRHSNELKKKIKYIILFKQKFIGKYNAVNIQKKIPQKDIFGFRKFIIIITSKGKILALDSLYSGTIVWSNQLGYKFNYKGLWIIKKSKTLNDSSPIIAVLGEDFKNMYFWRIDGLTGKIISLKKVDNDIKSSFILDHILTKDFDEKIIVAITKNKKVILLHDTLETFPTFVLEKITNMYFSTKNFNTLEGYFIDFKNLIANITWSIDFPSFQSIVSLSSINKNQKIASIGRVLSDRSVLYKYLNPHFLAVATGNKIDSKLNIYLIDIVKGMILYTNHYNNVDISKGVEILLVENWMIYQFWVEKPTKGYQIVVSELYENETKNKKIQGTNSSSINKISLPFVVSQAYIYPRRIRALTSVYGIQGILSNPTLLESTSIILAYGHDIFLTYITPSNSFDILNSDFSKTQLLLTVFILVVGLLLLKSMVKTKLLKKRWKIL
ncbi:hypothetical protein PORY_002681 [Pneumocystis oryctolagi]|uniref:Uncharacterized protein n=1 Tax=Pneumocystis oryctolagi TaxID=42067 RepID=A0ACB7CA63_9ASCO|nr:hypothetical protein PORY_002681 [Pneumocystis oryctolagi]